MTLETARCQGVPRSCCGLGVAAYQHAYGERYELQHGHGQHQRSHVEGGVGADVGGGEEAVDSGGEGDAADGGEQHLHRRAADDVTALHYGVFRPEGAARGRGHQDKRDEGGRGEAQQFTDAPAEQWDDRHVGDQCQ
ncbi:hypothetical protein OHB19_28855 [Streptomyces sp. NBC_00893]|nr:hypothetical protein [Streptomyces sp. NBC_00893]MCX4849298.1 hypothetical protein [Streptomyces sp. NBC_00893]